MAGKWLLTSLFLIKSGRVYLHMKLIQWELDFYFFFFKSQELKPSILTFSLSLLISGKTQQNSYRFHKISAIVWVSGMSHPFPLDRGPVAYRETEPLGRLTRLLLAGFLHTCSLKDIMVLFSQSHLLCLTSGCFSREVYL